eukprot:Opistho-2@43463
MRKSGAGSWGYFLLGGGSSGRVPALLLAAVHGRIGRAQQGLGAVAVFGVQGHADADARHDAAGRADLDRRRHGLQQLLGHALRIGRMAQRLDQHDELVAAQAAHQVVLAHGAAQALRQGAEHAVAGLVAMLVVDLLEAVGVDEEQAQAMALGERALHGLGQALFEVGPAGRAGQGVEAGLVGQVGMVGLQGLVAAQQFGLAGLDLGQQGVEVGRQLVDLAHLGRAGAAVEGTLVADRAGVRRQGAQRLDHQVFEPARDRHHRQAGQHHAQQHAGQRPAQRRQDHAAVAAQLHRGGRRALVADGRAGVDREQPGGQPVDDGRPMYSALI